MRRSRLLAVVACIATASFPVTVPRVAAAAPRLSPPAGYENFTTEVDYATFIGNAVRGSGNLTCTVDSTKSLPDFASTIVGPGTVVDLDDPTTGARLGLLFGYPGSEIASTCDVSVLLPTDRQTFTGTVTNPALKDLVGTDSGVFTLECDLKGSISVNASVRLGAALGAQKFALKVNSASTQVPFYCNMSMSFAGSAPSALHGTVEGRADVTSAISPDPCEGSTVKSCAPIQLKDALVTVTNGTGKFAGLSGTGTYNFVDTFGLPFVEEKLAGVGASSVSAAGARTRAVRAAAAPVEQMTLTLAPGAPKAKIVLPGPAAGATQANLTRGSKVIVSTAGRAKCAWTARARKSATVATTTANASGQATLTLTGARASAFSKSGVKKNGTVTLTARCTAGKRTATAAAKFTYTG